MQTQQDPITKWDIVAQRNAAKRAGDEDAAQLCEAALAGDEDALAAARELVLEARARTPDDPASLTWHSPPRSNRAFATDPEGRRWEMRLDDEGSAAGYRALGHQDDPGDWDPERRVPEVARR